MTTALTIGLGVLLAITSILLVLLILLHRGTGGGLSELFGGGITSGAAGSSVATRNLDRFTVALALIWAASIVATGLLVRS